MFFLPEWLACYERLADEIVALDNGSTDGTYELLCSHPKVVSVLSTEGYHEGRDKNLLYAEMRKRRPDWCLWVDVDELFEPDFTPAQLERMMNRRWVNRYAFRRFHFVDREHFAGSWFRLNYTAWHDRVLWRESPEGYFQNVVIDSPNVKGIGGITWYSSFRLKHLGYINKGLVDKKAAIYRNIIPEKEQTLQEMYMRGERSLLWRDGHYHFRVVLLNWLLNILQLKQIPPKVVRRVSGLFKKFKPMPATIHEYGN